MGKEINHHQDLGVDGPARPGWGSEASNKRWSLLRKAAGINLNDETAKMSPNDAIIYRLLSEERAVTVITLARTLRPDAEFRRANASANQNLINLRRILPGAINRSVVNVGTPNHAEYLLVEVGKEQETIKQYARERERRAAEEAAETARLKASRTIEPFTAVSPGEAPKVQQTNDILKFAAIIAGLLVLSS